MSVIEVRTSAFKKAIETAFAILEAGKTLDSTAFAGAMNLSLGTANKWLNVMTEKEILLREPIAGVGTRKYTYTRNNSVSIRYSRELQVRNFLSKLHARRNA